MNTEILNLLAALSICGVSPEQLARLERIAQETLQTHFDWLAELRNIAQLGMSVDDWLSKEESEWTTIDSRGW